MVANAILIAPFISTTMRGISNFNLAISEEAMDWLAKTTAGISNYAVFHWLLSKMALEDANADMNGRSVSLKRGELNCSYRNAAQCLGIDRETATKLLKKMESLGLIAIEKRGNFTTVIRIRCIRSWYLNGRSVSNFFFKYPSN